MPVRVVRDVGGVLLERAGELLEIAAVTGLDRVEDGNTATCAAVEVLWATAWSIRTRMKRTVVARISSENS